ncbi:MAG: PLP-dependent transferase, partial [Paracoccaceae bacterium]|nr:PLP-dependent transferase [Paracoccaceae bacterium]
RNDAILIADNALASPQFLQAGINGADIVVYSATKHIDGQGRSLGGIVIGSKDYIRGPFEAYLKHTGGAISPFNAWIMLKGLETLELRTNRQADSALRICQELEGHENLSNVIYPHLPNHPQYAVAKGLMTKGGTVFAIDFDGNKDASFKFMNNLEIVRISNNFGDAKSLVTHPATTTHQRLSEEQRASLGITDGLVRVSVGLENPDDLLEELVSAIKSI